MASSSDWDQQQGSGIAAKDRVEVPRRFKVVMHNDDYTTMEFVVEVLQKFFSKSLVEAQAIMLEVHSKGRGICGIYTREIAETKTAKVVEYARGKGHPLKCTSEPE